MTLHGGTVKFPQLATPGSPLARRAEVYSSQARLTTEIKAASRLLLLHANLHPPTQQELNAWPELRFCHRQTEHAYIRILARPPLRLEHSPSIMTGLHSPTLTNPDMILPNESPSSPPPSPAARALNNPFTQPRGSNSLGSEDDGEETMRRSVRRLLSNGIGSQRKVSSTSTARKSDQDSNETTIPGERTPTHHGAHDGLLLASSPTFRNDFKSSSEGGPDDISNDHWEGFDGPIVETVEVSIVENFEVSLHEADDPVSLDSLQGSHSRVSTPDENEPRLRSILDEDENDPASHAAMSKKAEQILANAKKRLLVRLA